MMRFIISVAVYFDIVFFVRCVRRHLWSCEWAHCDRRRKRAHFNRVKFPSLPRLGLVVVDALHFLRYVGCV